MKLTFFKLRTGIAFYFFLNEKRNTCGGSIEFRIIMKIGDVNQMFINHARLIILFTFIETCILFPMSEDIFKVFGISDNDGLKIRWAHAANSIESLNEALNDSKILMIESDIVLSSATGLPIMAHPPNTESDLSFEEWLLRVSAWNETKKGAKADFKSIESVQMGLPIVAKYKNLIHFPLWLNADICMGLPGSQEPLNGSEFLKLCMLHSPNSLLSLGWTTPATLTENEKFRGGYGSNEINSMISLLEDITEQTSVTFPVRAALITGNINDLIHLLSKSVLYSLTVWTSKSDKLEQRDFAALVEIRRAIGKDRVFYDLSLGELEQLKSLII